MHNFLLFRQSLNFQIQRKVKFSISFFALLLTLAGCGFKPLYGPVNGNDEVIVSTSLAAINVAQIPDRSGQVLRNHLLEILAVGAPQKTAKKYELDIEISETKRSLGFRRDKTPRRAEIIFAIHFKLYARKTRQLLTSGKLQNIASYSIGSSSDFASFSAIISEETARKRTLEAIAQDIKLQLAHFFSAAEEKPESRDVHEG